MDKKQMKPVIRRFNSYGPIDTEVHFYAPRKNLIEGAYIQLMGENPLKGGHYITVWAPRQTGKSWVMLQVMEKIKKQNAGTGDKDIDVDVVKVDLDLPGQDTNLDSIAASIADEIFINLNKKNPGIDSLKQLPELFTRDVLEKPLILIIDEFDTLPKKAISRLTRLFRTIYMRRQKDLKKPLDQRRYFLHALALIGVRSVLGIENERGSPFNVQRSVHIPNLTFEEADGLFQWYKKETGHTIEPGVIKKLYDETRGQPGLTCWLGELLTEGFEDYTVDKSRPIGMKDFNIVYTAATVALPNNNILNLISKTRKEENKTFILEMFKTGEKLEFTFDDPVINDLYMNGVVDKELVPEGRYYLRFSCPLVQKRIFNYFSNAFFKQMGQLVAPFTKLDHVITDTDIDVPNLLQLYQTYLKTNKEWLFKSAPRRWDMRIYEAIYHFNLFSYLDSFLKNQGGRVFPEFPTGNGKIDLIVTYGKNRYGIELKSFTNVREYKDALKRAAKYGKQLKLPVIYLVSFVEYIDEETAKEYEIEYKDKETGVTVVPVFIQTGS